ncbi:hypothetical protein ACFVVX_25710 [Kitasatospora sp. NPDC058170]|uniref:hypothetical protein n=1 Tax=Kitasatospora sp. NPDC058170 TaxID=3346364 RepID=UPI0036DA4DD2
MPVETDPRDLAARYVALWTEPDQGLRRKAIEQLWAADGAHILQPPAEIREAAAGLGFENATLEARGHDALELRVARSYQEFVAGGEYTFRPAGDAVRLRDVVTFGWEMAPAAGGEAVGGGLEVLVLDGDGRIRSDYMFPGA